MKRRALLAASLALPFAARAASARVVVVGGGFGGASAARALAAMGARTTLIEAEPRYFACPGSNAALAGLGSMDAQRFGWAGVAASGVTVVRTRATAVEHGLRRVITDAGPVEYDRLVLSPGIDLRTEPNAGGLPGYRNGTMERMPHAWKGTGPQHSLLRDQLVAMKDGGTVVIAVPATPYRCPPGPYERASLIAWYLKTHKPRSKLIVLDAKDSFSKQKLFQKAWAELYPGLLQWVGLSDGGRVTEVDGAAMTLSTEMDSVKADVANVIPPQRAGAIAGTAGVADRTGWCPIDPSTFESTLVPGIHVIGDAAILGAVPKAAFNAQIQGRICAAAVMALLEGQAPQEPRLINTCWSLVAPQNGISISGVYRPAAGQFMEIEGSGGTSPLDASPALRAEEAAYGEAWFKAATGAVFG